MPLIFPVSPRTLAIPYGKGTRPRDVVAGYSRDLCRQGRTCRARPESARVATGTTDSAPVSGASGV
jgi:hypothetical protein